MHASRPRFRPALTLGLLALAHFIVSVDFNIVYIALPRIGDGLGFSAQSLQWVVSAFALGYGGFLLLGGRTVDRLGPRRVFVLGLTLFGLASLLGGFATTPWMLVAGRAGQGLGAALLFPATLTLIGASFAEGAARNRAMGVWGTAGAFGAIAGGGIGGVLTSLLDWPSVFFSMVPLALVAIAGGIRLLPADPPPRAGRGGFDVPGAVIATAGSLLVVLGLVRGPEVGWGSIQGAGSAVTGAALLGVFLLVERFTRDPLVPSRMFGVRGLVAAMGLIFIVMGPVTALHYLYTTYMQDVLGYEALVAGLGFLPQGLVAMAGSALLLPFLLKRWGLRVTMFVGMVGVGATSAAFAAGMSVAGSYWTLLPALLLLGLTAGTLYPAIFTAAGTGVRPEEGGVASAMTSTAQQIGAAVGLAALVAVANAGLETGGTTAAVEVVDGLRAAGWAGAVATVAGAFIALAIRRAPRSARPEPAASPEGTGRAAAPST